MTLEEGQKICRVIAWADGGCPDCVRELITGLNAADLGLEWHFNIEVPTDRRVTVTALE